MIHAFLLQLVTLYWYVIFVVFCFSDGFKLNTISKLIWFAVFFASTIYVFLVKNEFDLAFILPIPTLLAIILCSLEKVRSNKAKLQ
ncbi:MAG: hypothetical protein V2A59_02665 [Candidatus Omnitrophota bacterium]